MSSSATTLSIGTALANNTTNKPSEVNTRFTTIQTSFAAAFNTSPATGHTHNGTDSAPIVATDLAGGENIFNDQGGALAAGDVVYRSGRDTTSGYVKVKKAQAKAPSNTSLYAELVVTATIADQATGVAYKRARVTGLDTSAGTLGRPVWLSNTAGGRLFSITDVQAGPYGAQMIGTPETIAVSGVMIFDIKGPIPVSYAHEV